MKMIQPKTDNWHFPGMTGTVPASQTGVSKPMEGSKVPVSKPQIGRGGSKVSSKEPLYDGPND